MDPIVAPIVILFAVVMSFVFILGQGRLAGSCLRRLLGGAVGSVGGCLVLVLFALFAFRSFVSTPKEAKPEPKPESTVVATLTLSPLPPVDAGTKITIKATSPEPLQQCSVLVKAEDGGTGRLSATDDATTFVWTPTKWGNYAVILNAETARGQVTARRTAYILPCVFYPPVAGYDPAAVRDDPYKRFGGRWFDGKVHIGIDLLYGSTDSPPVRAVADGKVKQVGSFGAGWGQVVVIEHTYEGDPVVAVYGHIVPDSGIKVTEPGEEGEEGEEGVKREQRIGVIDPHMHGPEGESGPHLHFGLFNGPYEDFPKRGWGAMPRNQFPGRWVDPTEYLTRTQGKPPPPGEER